MSIISKRELQLMQNKMIEKLGENYKHPSVVELPLFIVQSIITYDEDLDSLIYHPYVSVNTDEMFNSRYLDGAPSGLLTLLQAIASHVNKEGFAFPTVERLSAMTGLCKTTVIKYINAFANKQVKGRVLFYKQTIKRGRGKHDINLYYIPSCKVVFTDATDLETDEDKIDSFSHKTSEIFEMPDLLEERDLQFNEKEL